MTELTTAPSGAPIDDDDIFAMRKDASPGLKSVLGSDIKAFVGASGGGLTLIGETVADGTSGVLSIASIPASYDHLKLISSLRGSAAGGVNVTLNSNTSAIYDTVRLFGGSSLNDSIVSNQTSFVEPTIVDTVANRWSMLELDIYNYSDAANHKTVMGRSTIWTSGLIVNSGGVFKAIDVITSIQMTAASGNFVSGAKLQLWGY